MVSIFRLWSVSGLISEGAKTSQPLILLGSCVADPELFNSLGKTDKTTIIAIGKQFLVMKESFDIYIKTKNKNRHDDAVKFLVMVAAVKQGADGERWNWQTVRHLSQGLYGSMTEEPEQFWLLNIPLISNMTDEIEMMIEDAVR